MKNFLILAGSVFAASMIANRFILRESEEDTSGFITVSPGIGLDDAVVPVLSAAIYVGAKSVFGKKAA